MNRSRSFVIALASGLLAAVFVFAIYTLLVRQLEVEEKMPIVVPSAFIDAGTIIERDMVKIMYMNRSMYRSDMMSQLDEIVNQSTLIPLGKGEPILSWKVSQFHLLPLPGQSTFQIPKQYVLSISNGIRAGDRVRLYLSRIGSARQLIEREVTVASVKTVANTEVSNTQHSELLASARGDQELLYVHRRDANGAIEHVNLNLTEEEWLFIDEHCSTDEGKLVIAFVSSYWGENSESMESSGDSR